MNITLDDNFIYLSDVNRVQKDYLEKYINPSYSKTKGYRIPLNLWSLRELWTCFSELRNDSIIEVGKKLNREVDYLVKLRSNPCPSSEYHPSLRQYQNEDIDYLKQLKKAGVFNEPRTGKTPTMINLIKELNVHRTLIVCPASLIYNWEREFQKWYPEARVGVVSGDKVKRRRLYDICLSIPRSVLIISKDTLKLDIVCLQCHFDVVVVDEAHFLRNYKTAQSKALFKLRADRKYTLTGTPTVKHAVDIFGILHFLHPEKFPSYWQFAERYFEIGDNYLGHSEVGLAKVDRLEELQTMVGLMSVQRKRKEVMQWLPDKQYTNFYCSMSDKQTKLYKDMLNYFNAQDDDTEVDASTVLSQLTRLRQICLEPKLLNFDCDSAKTDALMEYLDDNREPIVIMSMFTSYLKLLKSSIESLGLTVGMIHGEMSNKDKMQQAEKFQRGDIDVLLCNIISAGTGFTLDKAETIIFTDKAWNPADNEQAEDRITPTTKDNVHKHTIINFVCQSTIDEKINDLLDSKKSITDIVNEGGLTAVKKLLLRG